MAIRDSLLPEFDHEMATTRRLLERVPDAELAWKPHEKSMSLGKLAGHIANLPSWCTLTLDRTKLDLETIADQRAAPPLSRDELLRDFDSKVKAARALLAVSTDPELLAPWTLLQAQQEFFTLPRVSVLRSFVLNHLIHHRGQLTVYLRLRDVPLPPIYGPTADEQ
jgi:uncharacterized damage-inducible protein DinB